MMEKTSAKEALISFQKANIYQGKTKILNQVDFEMKAGDFVYLIGKTGSGKSSFIKTLYGYLPLTEGSGFVADYKLNQLKNKDIPFLRRKLGVVFQDFQLLTDRSVYKNLEFVLKATGWKDKNKIKNRIFEALELVDMKDSAQKHPHQLSGGEQQRVVISRALLNEPDIILADEPTGNLDPQTSMEVMEILNQLNAQGQTILMATHDYALILKYPKKTVKCDQQMVFEVVQKSNPTT